MTKIKISDASASRAADRPAESTDITKTTKREQLATLLAWREGATLDQMITATGWLPHTTRAALSGLRKAGYTIDSNKTDGVRTYRAEAPQ